MEELLPGYRFYPTEEELVSFYLHHQLEGNRLEINQVIPVVDIYSVEPWHLPELAGERCQGDTEQWFFFVARQEREAKGGRPCRTTASGYWKATGSPGYVYSLDSRVIGVKKSMVFYKGKAPTGRKTKWKLNEYRAIEEISDSSGTVVPKLRHEFSLCRIYVISGSFQAFDRRPLEIITRDAQAIGDAATTFTRPLIMDQEMSSPDTSDSGGDQAGHPPENSGYTNWASGDAATTSTQPLIMVQEMSSPDTSYSGGNQAGHPPENAGYTNWEMVGVPEPLLWDWEQLNWS